MTQTAISVLHLNYENRDGVLLKDISFSVSKGGIHGLLSPFGADSSLLLDILAGVLVPSSAEIALDSVAINLSSPLWKKKIGYVPNAPVFYDSMTVYELLDFVGEARDVPAEFRLRQIEEALELVGLGSLAMRLVGRLSAGEKKRLSLALALLGNPSILLFDDPSPEYFDLIRMIGKHKTVLLGGADLSVMQELCEDVVLLSDGMLLASGSFAELEATLTSKAEGLTLSALYDSIVEGASAHGKKKRSIFSGREDVR